MFWMQCSNVCFSREWPAAGSIRSRSQEAYGHPGKLKMYAKGRPLALEKDHRGPWHNVNIRRPGSEDVLAWYGRCTDLNRKALQRVVKTAQHITRTELPSMEDLYSQRLRKKSLRIIKDPHHPSHKLFFLLPSGRRYRSILARTRRFRDSCYPRAVTLLREFDAQRLYCTQSSLFDIARNRFTKQR